MVRNNGIEALRERAREASEIVAALGELQHDMDSEGAMGCGGEKHPRIVLLHNRTMLMLARIAQRNFEIEYESSIAAKKIGLAHLTGLFGTLAIGRFRATGLAAVLAAVVAGSISSWVVSRRAEETTRELAREVRQVVEIVLERKAGAGQ